jgi:hypothetical protein
MLTENWLAHEGRGFCDRQDGDKEGKELVYRGFVVQTVDGLQFSFEKTLMRKWF